MSEGCNEMDKNKPMDGKSNGAGSDLQLAEITCDICMDLLPLVQDGIASEDSRRAVEVHLSKCERCREHVGSVYPGGAKLGLGSEVDAKKLWGKVMRKVRISTAALLMLGIFFGLSLTAGQEMFYNSLLMPLIGGVGYVVFRWHALYVVPVLMLATNCLWIFLCWMRGVEYLDLASGIMWVAIYSIFVAVGVLIAGLLHFAFRKEEQV